ncbi:hypothetical protein SVAN01_00418 [Stagonosporopsis vannaccii]|nr:hypothetical protein SVAN01_00418 [Stagonosporopsis vannaccii]
MSSSHRLRRAANKCRAREKALQTHVYISGLSGHHTLQIGLAYYYRGHYIYAYPAGTVIEPIPYSTRKGIMIQGIISESAPSYDSKAANLVEEESIRALTASIKGEKAAMSHTDSEEEPPPTLETPPVTYTSLSLAAPSSHDSRPPLHSVSPLPPTFTPQPGLAYLAASAPGSRLASRAASPADLRPTSSHIGLTRLQGQVSSKQGLAHARSPRAEGVGCEAGKETGKKAVKIGYLPGLGDHALEAGEGTRCETAGAGVAVAFSVGAVRSRLCAVYGDSCVGFSTERVWKTQQTRLGCGLLEDVPMVFAGGREMVDWVRLLREAREGHSL